jgi:fibronectin-binding autotransporter adhesin
MVCRIVTIVAKFVSKISGLALIFAFLFSLVTPSFAEGTNVWATTTGTGFWSTPTGAGWTNGFQPNAVDTTSVIITTNLTGNLTIVITNAAATTYNLQNFTMSNNTAFTSLLILSNNNIRVSGNTVIGSNATIRIGTLGVTVSSSTFSNNNLFLDSNAGIQFAANAGSALSTLIVAGTFTNTTQSALTNFNNGSMLLKFTDSTKIATNSGRIAFGMGGAGATFTIQAGTDAAQGTFHNAGTLQIQLLGTSATKSGTMSNLFVNSGFFSMTNNTTTAGDRRLTILFTGNITNQASGTFDLFSTNSASGGRAGNVITNSTGDFVNFGTITSLANAGVSGDVQSNVIQLAKSGGVFSNAVGGQVITKAGNTGLLLIRADKIVNLGTNLVGGGTLFYQAGSGGAGILENSGSIVLAGGNLNVDKLTNSSAGVIHVSGANTGTLVVNTAVNAGVTRLASSQTIVFNGSVFTNTATGFFENTGGTFKIVNAGGTFATQGGAGSNSWKFSSGTLLFSGGAGTYTISLGGKDFGNGFPATNNNYFIENLQMVGGAGFTLTLAGAAGSALYVGNLFLETGATLQTAGFNIYYRDTAATAGVTILGGGAIIKLGASDNFVFLQSSGVQNYDDAANWDQALVPINAANVAFITNSVADSMLVIQDTAAAAFTITSLIVSNSGGAGLLTVLLQRNQTYTDQGTIGAGARLVVSNGVTLTAPISLVGGTLNNNGTIVGTINILGGTADGFYTNGGTIVVSSGTLAGFVRNESGTINVAGGIVSASGSPLTNAARFIVSSGGVSNFFVNISGGSLSLQGGDFRRDIINDAGGTIVVSTGTGNVREGVQNSGVINLFSTGTLTGGTVSNLAGGVINALSGGNIDSRVVNSALGVINVVTNNGTAGTLRFGSATGLTNAGTINVSLGTAAGTLNSVEAWINTGNIYATNNSQIIGGALTNAGLLRSRGTIENIVNKLGGTWEVTNGITFVSGNLVNNGTLVMTDAAAQLRVTNAATTTALNFTNSATGTIKFNAGTITFSNAVNQGTIDAAGSGVMALMYTGGPTLTQQFLNTGRILFTGAAGGTLQIASTAGPAGTTGFFDNEGTIAVTGGAAGTFTFGNTGALGVQNYTNKVGGVISNTNAGVTLIFRSVANRTVNAGTMVIGAGATIQFNNTADTGNEWQNTGTIILGTGTAGGFLNQGTFNNSGFIIGAGTIANVVGATGTRPFNNLAGGQLVVTNGGNITFVSNSFVRVQGGTITVKDGASLTAYSDIGVTLSSLRIDSAGFVALVDGILGFSAVSNAGTIAGSGTISSTVSNLASGNVFASNGTLIVSLQPDNAGAFNALSSATLQFGTSGTLFVTNAGAINLLGGTVVAGGLTNVAGGRINSVTGTGTISAGLISNATGAFINATNGTLVLSGGLLNFGAVTNGGGTLRIGDGGLGILTNASGAVIAGGFASTGTLDGFVFNEVGGLVHATNGTLVLIKAPVNNGTFLVAGGAASGTLQIGAAGATAWANVGTLDIRGGTVVSGNLTNSSPIVGFGTITGKVVNDGTISVTNGVLQLINASAIVNNGTIDIASNATLSNAPALWANGGTILLKGGTLTGSQLNNSGTVLSSGGTITTVVRNLAGGRFETTAGLLTISNEVGSTVSNLAGGTYVVGGAAIRFTATGTAAGSSNAFRNAGTFIYNAGTIAVGNFVNVGTFEAAHTGIGTITSAGGGVFSNAAAGRIIVNSGTVLYSGGLDNLGVISAGAGGVFGTVGSAAVFTNNGTIINNASGVTMGIRANAGNFFNAGSMVVSNGATLNFLNAGGTGQILTNLAGARLIVGNAESDGVFNSGTIANSGTIDGSGTISLAIGTGGRPLINLDSGTLRVLNGRTLTITNVGGTAFRQVVIPDVQTNFFHVYNAGTIILGNASSMLGIASSTSVAGVSFPLDMLNTGTIQMNGGTLAYLTPSRSVLSNESTGLITGSGVITNATIFNAGTILATSASTPLNFSDSIIRNLAGGFFGASSGRTIVNTAFTNSSGGTVSYLNSVGTFNGTVVNSGTWILDPSTNVFNNTVTHTASGAIVASAGDVFIYRSDLVNQSTQSNTWNTFNAVFNTNINGNINNAGTKFIFDDTGVLDGTTQTFFHAGILLTGGFVGVPSSATDTQTVSSFGAVSGFKTNFALGTLEIGNADTNSILQLVDTFGTVSPDDGKIGALFVKNLLIYGDSMLVISNNMRVYFINSNSWSLANIALLGDAEIHQLIGTLAVIPEPNILLLLLAGGVTMFVARRRRKATTP